MARPASSSCPGCGLELPDEDGRAHPYIGASVACWSRFGEVLAREYGDLGYPPWHRVTVDVYAVQHPGVPERRSEQSVGVHLMGLCLVLERGVPPERATGELTRILARPPAFRWLEPPRPNGVRTVLDVLAADGADEHETEVWRWAGDVWAAWTVHHPVVDGWLGEWSSGG